jgi:AAA ATPase domain
VILASRIVDLAEPGQLAITEATRKAVEDYFVIHAAGEHRLPGRAAAVKVYQVVGAPALRTRMEVGLERGLMPFVGRVKELALLHERLAEARAGRGRIVLLAGEPGVGKSRLLLELKRSLGENEVCWLAGRSISFGSQMAYLPIIDLLRPTNAAGFTLQSTTNLGSSAVWTTNSPAPVVVNGQNKVKNPISGAQQFYRFSQ